MTPEEYFKQNYENKSNGILRPAKWVMEFAENYHKEQLRLHVVGSNEVALIEPLRNFIRSKHLSSEWGTFLKDYERNL